MPTPSLIEVHEDRLSRLEEDVTECRVDLATVKTKIDDGVEMLSKKLDEVTALAARVTALETTEQVRDKVRRHRRRMYKVAAGVVAGIGSVVGFLLKLILGS